MKSERWSGSIPIAQCIALEVSASLQGDCFIAIVTLSVTALRNDGIRG